MCYGNVNTRHDGTVNLSRISNNVNDDSSVGNVLVIWCATRPERGTVVVGWYRNATIFADWQRFENRPAFQEHIQNGIEAFRIQTTANNAFLLSSIYRNRVIPRATRNGCGFGQANIRYMDEDRCEALRESLVEYINGFDENDPRLMALEIPMQGENYVRGAVNREVEIAAIEFAMAFYTRAGYTVNSVETRNLGWDLVARNNQQTLRIEVKGLSGDQCSIGLTANEYRAFQSADDNYRLFVVASCLRDTPNYFICNKVDGHMIFEKGDTRYTCVVNQVTSAIVALGSKID